MEKGKKEDYEFFLVWMFYQFQVEVNKQSFCVECAHNRNSRNKLTKKKTDRKNNNHRYVIKKIQNNNKKKTTFNLMSLFCLYIISNKTKEII